MENYQEARVKRKNTQINKLKSPAKNKKVTISRINKEKFQDKELPGELLLKARQATKVSHAFANNMSTDIKFSKAQISKIIQSCGSPGSWLCNLGKKNNNRFCNFFSER